MSVDDETPSLGTSVVMPWPTIRTVLSTERGIGGGHDSLYRVGQQSAKGCMFAHVGVRLLSFDSEPILSWPDTSSFGQVFNPAWIGGPKPGLLIRTQNCTARVGDCVRCSGNGSAASVLTFSAQQHNWKGGPPTYAPLTGASVVFGPHGATDDLGTEDPRVTYDASSGTHYMFYTCYNSGSTPQPRVTLCLATTADPSSATGWARHRNAHCMQTYGT